MGTLLLLSLCALCVKQLMTLSGIAKSFRFLRRQRCRAERSDPTPPIIIVVIPVLREQSSIEAAVAHFSRMPYASLRIVVVSTEREGPTELPGSTMEVLRRASDRYRFVWLHYPDAEGTKADQINYVIDQFIALFPECPPERSFIAVYDADSRPSVTTFECLSEQCGRRGDVRVFQQSALFDLSPASSVGSGAAGRIFLRANAVRATRFVFGYEIPRLLNRLAYYEDGGFSAALGRVTYAHCVGHGLFVRLDLARSLRFPPGAILEDMFYGFLLNCAEEPVVPLPLLDYAEVPPRVATLFFQMSRWFLGPSRSLTYFNYARRVVAKGNAVARARPLVLSGWWYAANWLFTSPVILAAIWISALGRSFLLQMAACAFLAAYCSTVSATILMHNWALEATVARGLAVKLSVREGCWILAVYPLVLVCHSLPAYHCLFDLLISGGRGNRRRKTERL